MARKWAENHRIRAIHLHGRLNGVLVEFLQEGAINANLAPTTIPPCPLHPIIIEDLIICKHGALTLCLASFPKLWAHNLAKLKLVKRASKTHFDIFKTSLVAQVLCKWNDISVECVAHVYVAPLTNNKWPASKVWKSVQLRELQSTMMIDF